MKADVICYLGEQQVQIGKTWNMGEVSRPPEKL